MSITTAIAQRVYSGQSAGEAVKSTFGFPSDTVAKIIKGAHDAASFITSFYPKTARGTMLYFELVSGLRENLSPYGWSQECESGLELTVSPDRRRAILVKPGDECTGVNSPGFIPRLKRPGGVATQRVVERNKQLFLFPELAEDLPPPQIIPETWILLHQYVGNAIQAELSLPSGLEGEKCIMSWERRICLPDVPLDSSSDIDIALPAEEYPDFDVTVERKR